MTTTANWYHAHQDSVKRSEGKSAVGLVAYITGQPMKDERTGVWCIRNHPGEVLAWGTVAPDWGSPHLIDTSQISKVWNEVERSETRINSIVAAHWNVAGSREFSHDDHEQVARDIAAGIMQRYGVMVTYGIHKPTDHGDDRNWHYHFGHNMRRVTSEGFGEKAREIIDKKTFVQETTAIRAMIAHVLNERLAHIGSTERVTHLSYEDRGVVQEPTKHLGNKQNQSELKGQSTETGDENRAIRERNEAHVNEQKQRRAATDRLDAEIIDILAARLKQMREGTRKVEIPEHQWDQRDQIEKDRLAAMTERRQALAAFDLDYEEQQKRLARTSSSRTEEMESRANRGDLPNANDRWAKAMHDSHNPRAKAEENLAVAVGFEAEMFRREQKEMREAEAKETDPAKKKLMEFNRQIAACDYMAIGAERCAAITGFIVGKSDNAISNEDRKHAGEWREIGAKLREDRTELRETIDKGLHDDIANFLKDMGRGFQPTAVQRDPTQPESKDQGFGVSPSDYEKGPVFGRDLPADAQPEPQNYEPAAHDTERQKPKWRDLNQNEIMPPGAHFRTDFSTMRTQVDENTIKQPEKPAREGALNEEITDAKANQQNKEDTTFDQGAYDKYWEQVSQETSRGRGGGMSR
jgi:MobA/MobL family